MNIANKSAYMNTAGLVRRGTLCAACCVNDR